MGRFDSDTSALAARLAGHGLGAQQEFTEWLVDLVAARSGMRILDLGSGLGIPSLALTKVVGSTGTVVAVDRSLRALVALRDSAAKEARDRVVVPICQDLDSLSSQRFKAGMYDRVTAVYSLYYSRAPLQVVPVVRSMLGCAGRFVVAGPHPLGNGTFRELCRKAYGRPIPSRTRATRFMTEVLPAVLPRFFPYINRRVLVTRVIFSDPVALLSYWRAHNWYEPSKEGEIRETVRQAFLESEHLAFTKHTVAFIASASPLKGNS